MEKNKRGSLYIVGTPIGNMGDISQRAVSVLSDVDVIACEDTRHSRVLLDKLGINKRLISYHKHNERSGSEYVISLMDQGADVALISDAGMPCVSDPGAVLVNEARCSGIKICCVPGPTALTSAVALSGIEGAFTFIGFLPDKRKDRTAIFTSFKAVPSALVFYCSPHDLIRDLDDMYEFLGARGVCVVREITKLYEEVVCGELGSVDVGEPRGEYVVIVAPPAKERPQDDLMSQLKSELALGVDKKEAVKKVAKDNGVPKDVVYKLALEIND
ncbi:MAG: 16S rRNA (cytidine(1402)-2'-O)-methyltransferase [Clostridia bacterium]|nr:16S rRNA (cytidine(1402)-2'-O)-methyltransferase [Clostridia bacterium]